MIDSLAGCLLELDEDYAVVDVGGIRFRSEIASSTARQLPPVGERVELLTRLSFNANDGEFSLFGFASSMERECFEILTSMTGIGPRKAMMILSQIEIASFARAVVNSDVGYVSKIKGIGKKTAERLVLELRDKMAPMAVAGPDEPASPPRSTNVRDAIAAMMALGCRPAVAERAVESAAEALGEDASTEALIREGLKRR